MMFAYRKLTLALLGLGLPELDLEQFPFMLSKEDTHDDGHDHEHEDRETINMMILMMM
jgi:hypothetical protein